MNTRPLRREAEESTPCERRAAPPIGTLAALLLLLAAPFLAAAGCQGEGDLGGDGVEIETKPRFSNWPEHEDPVYEEPMDEPVDEEPETPASTYPLRTE
ncbi:MAG: hypothetical protein ACOC0J_02640, partial [Myxococcota bacterium]